jgi:hypothetical protein
MAMQLAQTLSTGVVGNYWKISTINISIDQRRIQVGLNLYLCKDARTAGNGPLSAPTYYLIGNDYDTAMASPKLVDFLYAYLKLQPAFLGEADC